MVEVICEKTGLVFEARSRRTKNHPEIMAIINEAYRDGWYGEAQLTLERGRRQHFTTIEQFVNALRATEATFKAERDAAFDAKLQRERELKEARRQRAITNALLRGRGYQWHDLGFRDEEDADFTDFVHAPIGRDWHLYSPDDRPVTVQQAMQELAAQDVKFAVEWLTERGIAVVAPEPEPVEVMQARVTDTAETHAAAEAIADHYEGRIKTGDVLTSQAESRAKPFPDPALYARVFIAKYQQMIERNW